MRSALASSHFYAAAYASEARSIFTINLPSLPVPLSCVIGLYSPIFSTSQDSASHVPGFSPCVLGYVSILVKGLFSAMIYSSNHFFWTHSQPPTDHFHSPVKLKSYRFFLQPLTDESRGGNGFDI